MTALDLLPPATGIVYQGKRVRGCFLKAFKNEEEAVDVRFRSRSKCVGTCSFGCQIFSGKKVQCTNLFWFLWSGMTPCFFCDRCFNQCPVGDMIGCTGKEASGGRCCGLLMTNPYVKNGGSFTISKRWVDFQGDWWFYGAIFVGLLFYWNPG